jgi:general secretion pathway protein J
VIRNPPSNCNKAARGFTLLEVMIALVISALIAVMAFQSLDAADRGASRTNEVLNEINKIDRAWQIIAADFRHLLGPSANDPNWIFKGENLNGSADGADQTLLLFKRRGWVNFSNLPRSDLQLVGYRILDGVLWRDFVPEYNRQLSDIDLEEDDGFHQLLLEGVEDMQLRFLHAGAIASRGKSVLEGREYSEDWLQDWPDATSGATGLPLAIEITIQIKGVGSSVRLFAMPEQFQQQ